MTAAPAPTRAISSMAAGSDDLPPRIPNITGFGPHKNNAAGWGLDRPEINCSTMSIQPRYVVIKGRNRPVGSEHQAVRPERREQGGPNTAAVPRSFGPHPASVPRPDSLPSARGFERRRLHVYGLPGGVHSVAPYHPALPTLPACGPGQGRGQMVAAPGDDPGARSL